MTLEIIEYIREQGGNLPVQEANSQLYNGDCFEIMEEMIQKGVKVDAIITSPPYNMNLRVRKGKYVSRCGYKESVNEFSTKYKNFSDDLPMDKYFEQQKEFLTKALTLSDIVFYNIQMITGNKPALFKLLGEFSDKIKEVIIWNKGYAQPAMMSKMLNSQFEFIFVLQNSKPYNRAFDVCNFARGTETNVWDIKRERNTKHKASFPVELVERILRNFTTENSTVLDPFMGSGTTGVACKNLNRNFIGIELDKEYYQIAKKSIEMR